MTHDHGFTYEEQTGDYVNILYGWKTEMREVNGEERPVNSRGDKMGQFRVSKMGESSKLIINRIDKGDEFHNYLLGLIQEIEDDGIKGGKIRGISETTGDNISPKTTRGANSDTPEKLAELARIRQEAIDSHKEIPGWSKACQTAGISRSTARNNAPELRKNWYDKSYKWHG